MGVLTIPTTELGYEYDLLIEPWSKKLNGFRKIGERLTPLDGGLGLGFNILRQFDSRNWCDSIPTELVEATKHFPEYQYQMLWLAANCLPAKQILEVRPMILALICDKHNVDNTAAKQLCKMGQKEILDHLGLDGTKAALRFIDKLDLEFDKGDELKQVKRMLSSIQKRYLRVSHYERVDYTVMKLDRIFPFLSGSRLGRSLAEQQTVGRRATVAEFQDALMLGIGLGLDHPMDVISSQRSLAGFRALHDRWARRNNRWIANREHESTIDWDKAYYTPLQGSDVIEPIRTYRELHAEGIEQKHCIAVYHDRIRQKEYLAFRMYKPQRLTIGVRRVKIGRFPFVIDQISGIQNRQPSERSREVIKEWFDELAIDWKAKARMASQIKKRKWV